MEMLNLLLTLFAVSGRSYVLQSKLTPTQISGIHRDQTTELIVTELGGAFISVDEKGNGKKNMVVGKSEEQPKSEMSILETNPVEEFDKDNTTERDRRSEGGPTKEASEENTRMDKLLTGLAETKSIEEIVGSDQWYEKVTEDSQSEKVEDDRKAEMENEESGIVKETLMESKNNSRRLETANNHNSLTQFESDNQNDNLRQRTEQEEEDSMLMAGIHPVVKTGDTHEDKQNLFIVRQENEEVENAQKAKKGENMKNVTHDKEEVHVLPPPLSTSSSHMIVPTKEIIESQIVPVSPPHQHHHVTSTPAVTPTQPPSVPYISPQFPPSSAATLSHINTGYDALTAGDVKSMSWVEELIIEVLQRSESKLNKLELKARPNIEDVRVKNIQVNPTRKEVQTTYKEDDTRDINSTIQAKEIPFISQAQVAMPKPIEATMITAHFRPAHMLKEPTVSPKFKENKLPANLTQKPDMIQATAQNKTAKLTKNKTKRKQNKNKASPPKPQLTKLSAKEEQYKPNGKMHTKFNRSSKNKTIKKMEETKEEDNKTHKRSEEPTFPYFMDNYCPPECVCYGRVVQCSDKGVQKIPYGIPYNARYILLMNNQINNIQLDVLNGYVFMEFLVLSNNHLTDSAIEGVFVGVPALRRLHLDRNLLETVPIDLPISLEELHLDYNRVSVISEVAWAHCPGLLVLSLSHNSLGNGSKSLPEAVLSPLCSLRTLNLDRNQLISVPLGLPLSIKELYLKGNLIERFCGGAFNGFSELLLLDLSANRLTNKGLLRESLLNATQLESLNLEGNKLKRVPQHLPLSLKTLNLEGNLITSIKKASFSTFKNLEHLGLARNNIFKVAPGAFGMLPALHQLDLCYNTLRQVPRQLPQGLHSLALNHNKIQFVPRDAFCWGNKSLSLSRLVHVQLENNFIDLGTLDTQAFRCLRGFQVVRFY